MLSNNQCWQSHRNKFISIFFLLGIFIYLNSLFLSFQSGKKKNHLSRIHLVKPCIYGSAAFENLDHRWNKETIISGVYMCLLYLYLWFEKIFVWEKQKKIFFGQKSRRKINFHFHPRLSIKKGREQNNI